jgi:hypothetical protein
MVVLGVAPGLMVQELDLLFLVREIPAELADGEVKVQLH